MSVFSEFKLPTEMVVGSGIVDRLAPTCGRFGKKILFVYPAQLEALATPHIDAVRHASLEVVPFRQDEPEPTVDFINFATLELKPQNIDLVVGFGGGSAMDLAKAFAISLVHEEDIWLFANLSNRPPIPFAASPLPIITVPTTSGTGSEVTPYAVLTRPATQQKGTVQEPGIFPKVALIDPDLTADMPSALAASTGIDAFAHALEATINVSKASPMAELFGVESMKRIVAALPDVVENPANAAARAEMSLSACLAGMAISHRGTTTTHAIAEPLGALTHIPHGVGVAISTIPVLRATVEAGDTSLSRLLAPVFGTKSSGDVLMDAVQVVDQIEDLITKVGMNKTVSDILGAENCTGLASELIESIMKFKFRPLKQHPVEFDADSLAPIVETIIHGKPQ